MATLYTRKVMIAGQSADRNALKSGMSCEVTYMPSGGDAISINC